MSALKSQEELMFGFLIRLIMTSVKTAGSKVHGSQKSGVQGLVEVDASSTTRGSCPWSNSLALVANLGNISALLECKFSKALAGDL